MATERRKAAEPVTHDDIAAIHDRLQGHCERMGRIEERLESGDIRMGRIEAKLEENTELTREVVDILDSGKAAFKLLHQIGLFAKWLAAITGAIAGLWAVFHLGPDK